MALAAELREQIQAGYRAFLAGRGLRPRVGQRRMIAAIAGFLAERADASAGGSRVCAIEAGTGTGKTLAYLLAALPVARSQGKKLVIATGTVALQGQLVERDIPDLLAATGWDFQYALAKGRGRYLCPLRLEQCETQAGQTRSGRFLFEDELSFVPEAGDERRIEDLGRAFRAGDWDGDRDHWEQSLAAPLWRALSIDGRQCGGRRCRLIATCCYYRARAAVDAADCIVANQDLVMADLALGGGVVLPAPEDTIYVFDEAHRLADTALAHLGAHCEIEATGVWLERLQTQSARTAARFAVLPEEAARLADLAAPAGEAALLLRQVEPLFALLLTDARATRHRFPNGLVPDVLRAASTELAAGFSALMQRLERCRDGLEAALERTGLPVARPELEAGFQAVGQWIGRCDNSARLWAAMAAPDVPAAPPLARWVVREPGGDLRVAIAPVSAGATLVERLWSRCHAAVLTSATLRSLGSFDRLRADAGIPEDSRTEALDGAFDYRRRAVLAVPAAAVDGGDNDAHTAAVSAQLPGLLAMESGGSLVLFASRQQLERVRAALPAALSETVLVQGELSVDEIVARHRERVDRGERSTIFGLASFAEGIDLPGDYCRHVIIAKLPFAVPDDPMQEARAEWIQAGGGNAFRTLSLADACLRLVQACGRLLRTETDSGRVTILDRRLVSKGYGRELLAALPPFGRD